MKKLLCILIFALFSVSAFAQDAIVQPLTPQEATQAKKLYQAKQDAEKAWTDFNSKLKTEYAGKDWDGTSFKFSKDFRFIVPDGYVVQWNTGSGNPITLPVVQPEHCNGNICW